MKYTLCLVLFAILLFAGCGPTKHLNDKITWLKFDAVQANFPAAPHPGSKPMLVYFRQNHCNYCMEMDSVLERPEVSWYINENFLPVTINVDTDLPLHVGGEEISYQRMFQIFKMEGFPAFYAFDTTGQVLGMTERSMHVLAFKQTLKYIREGHFGKVPFDDFQKMKGVPDDTTLGVF